MTSPTTCVVWKAEPRWLVTPLTSWIAPLLRLASPAVAVLLAVRAPCEGDQQRMLAGAPKLKARERRQRKRQSVGLDKGPPTPFCSGATGHVSTRDVRREERR